MWRDARFLSWSDFRIILREREVMFWAFIMPVVFFYFIGTITGGAGRSRDERDTLAVLVPADAGLLADQLVQRLEAAQYRVERVATEKEFADFDRQVRIPSGFTASVLAGKPAAIRLEKSGGGLGSDFDSFRVNRAVYTLLADLIVLSQQGDTAPTAELFAKLAARPRYLSIVQSAAGKRREIPSGFQQSVPGTMVFLVLLVLATSGAGLVMERDQGLLRRLASSPMSRTSVVMGKWGARVLLSLLQIAFAMLVGWFFFKIQWGPHYVAVAGILLAYVALAASLGLLLGNYCRTQGQVVAAGVIGSNLLAALGGCWWPAEITPDWCQKLAMCLPTGWVMDALHQLMSFGASPSEVVPHFVALVVAAIISGWLVVRNFRFI